MEIYTPKPPFNPPLYQIGIFFHNTSFVPPLLHAENTWYYSKNIPILVYFSEGGRYCASVRSRSFWNMCTAMTKMTTTAQDWGNCSLFRLRGAPPESISKEMILDWCWCLGSPPFAAFKRYWQCYCWWHLPSVVRRMYIHSEGCNEKSFSYFLHLKCFYMMLTWEEEED